VTPISQRVGCVTPVGGTNVNLVLQYDPSDPLVLWFVFTDRSGVVRWEIGRELVWDVAGRAQKVAAGDVRMWPHSLDQTGLRLCSGGAPGEYLLRTRELLRFVCRTFGLVPRDRVPDVVGAELDRMLREVAS
jgi:Streptomyces sporulation and cell division protein, SsgA